jgi:hypothetical protein
MPHLFLILVYKRGFLVTENKICFIPQVEVTNLQFKNKGKGKVVPVLN